MITTIEIPIEKQKQMTLSRAGKTIYLGIPTNILCVDDRLEPKRLSAGLMSDGENIKDFTATLYLGKITFKKNKQGNLAPIYIPSTITESSFEGLNTFWLNEINPHPKKPFRSMMQCEMIMEAGLICQPDKESIPYQNIYYYRTKDNIVLTKAQIISYFTELHKLNTTFIKNYIDSINKEECIRAYLPTQEIYKTLIKLGILQKDMFKWGFDGHVLPDYYARLVSIDYMKQQGKIFPIPYFDELFYVYFIVSLKNFVLKYYDDSTKEYVDTNKLIFNTGAYRKYYDISLFERETGGGYFYKNNERIYGYEVNLFMQNEENMWAYIAGFAFQSPNLDFFGDMTIKPSPLGNYYFEIASNKGTFIEYYQRIYPKLDNPPKGWSKEMMQKLDLKLE